MLYILCIFYYFLDYLFYATSCFKRLYSTMNSSNTVFNPASYWQSILIHPNCILYCFFLFVFSKPIEPDRLFDCLPKSLQPQSDQPGNQTDGRKPEHRSLEAAVYKTPTLIPPRVLPLLHDLANQLVQAGHQQQCAKIYRYLCTCFFPENWYYYPFNKSFHEAPMA